jgi:hypothetical protein
MVELHVRGEIPDSLYGSIVVATSRRNKIRTIFSRWHDSQTDIMKINLIPGKPGRVCVQILSVDPSAADVENQSSLTKFDKESFGKNPEYGYATQPNHAINVADGYMWATNLLFGAPLEIDLKTFKPQRILRYVRPNSEAARVSTTSHFAWSLDGKYAYFHQSLLEKEKNSTPVKSKYLKFIELDIASQKEKVWDLHPPKNDKNLESANFHSAFYFEENNEKFVGLLKTGAVLESLAPHAFSSEHRVKCMPVSEIWIIKINHNSDILQAELLPGIKELNGLALSHLDVDNAGANGFILYANYKEADVAEETHGTNIYGEKENDNVELYSGMVVEAMNYGQVIRYERRNGKYNIRIFKKDYNPAKTSEGHSWLPINIKLDESKKNLFCSFSGFRPRLLPKHIASAYKQRVVDKNKIRYVPPVLIRLNSQTLQPEFNSSRDYISYAEPMGMTVVGSSTEGFIITFSPEIGLRIYKASDLSDMICHAYSAELLQWEDSHFRPEPAHLTFIPM